MRRSAGRSPSSARIRARVDAAEIGHAEGAEPPVRELMLAVERHDVRVLQAGQRQVLDMVVGRDLQDDLPVRERRLGRQETAAPRPRPSSARRRKSPRVSPASGNAGGPGTAPRRRSQSRSTSSSVRHWGNRRTSSDSGTSWPSPLPEADLLVDQSDRRLGLRRRAGDDGRGTPRRAVARPRPMPRRTPRPGASRGPPRALGERGPPRTPAATRRRRSRSPMRLESWRITAAVLMRRARRSGGLARRAGSGSARPRPGTPGRGGCGARSPRAGRSGSRSPPRRRPAIRSRTISRCAGGQSASIRSPSSSACTSSLGLGSRDCGLVGPRQLAERRSRATAVRCRRSWSMNR